MNRVSPRSAAWIWPLRIPRRVSHGVLRRAQRLDDWLQRRYRWLPLAAACGAVPVLLAYWFQMPGNHAISGTLLAILLVAAVSRDATARGLSILTMGVIAHSIATLALAAHDPERLAVVLPHGADYWDKSRHWIATGINPEYDVNYWLGAHAQLSLAVVLLTYTSLGMVTLWHGLHEVDLMNFYVGQLMANSENPWLALALGWHPWSVCRGLGFLLLTFEVASLSLSRMTGMPLSTPRKRLLRWAGAVLFLLLDAGIKFFALDHVRGILAANVVG